MKITEIEIDDSQTGYCWIQIHTGNRKKAIKIAISELKQKEVLIIAGKGHEKYQIIKEQKIPFDDVKIVNKFIKEMNRKNAKKIPR